MDSRTENLWRWLWLSPALVLAQASWCALHGRALGASLVGFEVALPWAARSAVGWTLAGILLGAFGHRVFGSALAQSRRWTVRALAVIAVFAITMSSEAWLLSGDTPLPEWLYGRAPLHLTFAALLVGGFLLLPGCHEARTVAPEVAPEPLVVDVMTGTGRTQVRVDDIECLEADRNYINVHTPQRSYLLRQTLSSLEETLRSRDFLRVHRSVIVNRAMIRERRGGGVLVLRSGRTVRVSRAYARHLN
jgi:hypothetical protein